MTARLKERYQHEVVPQLRQTYAYQNPHEVPRLTKIVVNMGVGEAIQNSKILDSAVNETGFNYWPKTLGYQVEEVNRQLQTSRWHVDWV